MRFEPIELEKYCWNLGTTSFRVKDLLYFIVEQLKLIKVLNERYSDLNWNEEKQIKYSEILNEFDLFNITKTFAKDARVKTSSLVELGLVTENRKLTDSGKKLLQAEEKKLEIPFDISNESYIILDQLCKVESYDFFKVRPFYSTVYFLLELGKLSNDQFAYIVPLCKTKTEVLEAIKFIKSDKNELDYLIERIGKSSKTAEVVNILNNYVDLSKDELLSFFPHGKGKNYVKNMTIFIEQISNYKENINKLNIDEKVDILKKLDFSSFKNKGLTEVKSYLFGEKIKKNNSKKIITHFEKTIFFKKNEILATYILYTFNAYVANLKEYLDLNIRYFKLTDIFLIEHGEIKLDILPEVYFEKLKDSLLNIDIKKDRNFLEKFNQNGLLKLDSLKFEKAIHSKYPQFINTNNLNKDIKEFSKEIKDGRIRKLMEENFKKENLIKLLGYLKDENLKELNKWGFECESLPTISEYLVGISWYHISKYHGDILSYLNMRLDNNLFPVRFAGGGESDIVYKYDDGHDVLIEVTMSNKEAQRKMELEPVTRHLGRYKIDQNSNSYCIFVTNRLDPNVLISFRSYKDLPYYNPNNMKRTESLKIIPLEIEDLITIIDIDMNYYLFSAYADYFYKLDNESLNLQVYDKINEKNRACDGYEWYKKFKRNLSSNGFGSYLKKVAELRIKEVEQLQKKVKYNSSKYRRLTEESNFLSDFIYNLK